jgi:hypothetical protein
MLASEHICAGGATGYATAACDANFTDTPITATAIAKAATLYHLNSRGLVIRAGFFFGDVRFVVFVFFVAIPIF